MIESLRRARDERAYVELSLGERSMRGFVIGVSSTLVLFQRYNELFRYGYAIVRVDSVDDVDRDDPTLLFFAAMLAGEGLGPRELAFPVPLDSLPLALGALQRQGILVELQNEDFDADHGVEVGRIVSVYDHHVALQLVSASGEWEDGELALEIANVWRIVFATDYLTAIQKYSGDPDRTAMRPSFRVPDSSGPQEALQRVYEARAYCWIETEGYTTMGFVVGISDELVLVHAFSDLTADGFVVIPRSLIVEVSWDGDNLRFFERMLEGEQVLDDVGAHILMPLGPIAESLHALRARDLVVQLDTREGTNVGTLLEIDERHTRLRYLSASGVWDDDVRTIERRSSCASASTTRISGRTGNTRPLRAADRRIKPAAAKKVPHQKWVRATISSRLESSSRRTLRGSSSSNLENGSDPICQRSSDLCP